MDALNPLGTPADGGAMSDDELASILAANEAQAVGYYTSEIADEQARAIDYYYGRPFGDEQPGRSRVVDRTVAIVVDNAVAAVLKPFVSADETVSFEPVGEEDVEQAEQATEYVNYVVHNDNPGFLILHNWFKSAMLEKLGIVKAWWEDTSRTTVDLIEGLDALQLEQVMQTEDVVDGPYQDGDFFAVRVRRMEADGRIRIVNVPSEEFLISPYARSIEDCPYVCHRPTTVTRTDLIEMGFDPEVVAALPASSSDTTWDTRSLSRYQDEEFNSTRMPGGTGVDPSQDIIDLRDEYIRVDYDGDGRAEYRRVIRVDDVILFNEEWDGNPFAVVCPVPMAHKVYGLSLADQVMDLQRISSALWRQTLDNLYLANNPKIEVPQAAERNDGSTYDDLMDTAPGGVVRTQQGGMINPLAVPFVADKSFPMLQFIDQQQEARTGIKRGGQGLDSNALAENRQLTATQAMMIEDGNQARSEMIARIFAETGVKRLFKLILRLLVQHQPRARMIRLRNKWVSMDPRGWNADMDLTISVGLGVGNKAQQVQQAQGVLQAMEALAATPFGSMITPMNAFNAMKRLLSVSGIKNIDDYLTQPDPNNPPQPPPDPETIKVQADSQVQAAKLQLEQQKAAAQLQQSQAESAAKLDAMREEAALKLQLEREKYAAQNELAIQQMNAQIALDQRRMDMEMQLAEKQADRQHELAMKQADAKISQNRPGGDLDK